MPRADYEPLYGSDAELYDGGVPEWQLPLLNVASLGMQFAWTIELGYGTPFLLTLGIPKPLMALVWIAGPLSGLLIQPIVGFWSDNSRSRFGRRRPFMVGGGVLTVGAMLVIAYAKEIGTGISQLVHGDVALASRMTAWSAVIGFYVLDFSINAVMAAARALSLDIPSVSQQSTSSAWAGRFIGFGNIAGYLCGYIDLPKILSFLGDTQMKILCWLAIAVFVISLTITCLSVSERQHQGGIVVKRALDPFLEIWRALRRLPPPIQGVCNVQFFAWIGWFPVFFYGTSWVAEKCSGHPLEDAGDAAEECTREGSRAMLIFALVSTATSVVVPWVKRQRYVSGRVLPTLNEFLPTTPHLWFSGCLLMASAMFSTFGIDDASGATVVIAVCGVSWGIHMYVPYVLIGEHMRQLQVRKKGKRDIRNEASSPTLGSEANRLQSSGLGTPSDSVSGRHLGGRKLRESDDESLDGTGRGGSFESMANRKSPPKRRSRSHVIGPERSESESDDDSNKQPLISDGRKESLTVQERSNTSVESQIFAEDRADLAAGTIIGIQNLYVVVPQFITTFLSSMIFAIVSQTRTVLPDGTVETHDAFSWVLRMGGVGAVAAAVLCLRLKDVELDTEDRSDEISPIPVMSH
ncbi:MFS general substrate transporter [Gonapodya prolifera JEL478]|uniref:MFS general substrate transporter n=1 Tax=Gonapodya prolifera (strain JEL478) TaxID=1344416 RepID=A0A139AVN8_GONPJ|nr:MFS general substrate transporter [Gonapodya prolifera JEL478]|eukprot:KXS20764.1 MFS general substrate transporter [Gonapodya prolifera JEL478]